MASSDNNNATCSVRACLLRQVIEATEDGQLILNTSTLEDILLDEQWRDKFLLVISMSGEFQTGKSQALELLGRHFRKAEMPPLHDAKLHKRGIFLSKEPVTELKLSGDQEVAVFLMDTSGLLDGFSRSLNSKIFALSLLTSSVQIFNTDRLNSGLLEYLQFLIEFARFNLDQFLEESGIDNIQIPFQQLVLFVRQPCEMLSKWVQRMPDFGKCLDQNFCSPTECFVFPAENEDSMLTNFVELIVDTKRTAVAKTLDMTAQQLFRFILNLGEHFQLLPDEDRKIVKNPQLSNMSLYELASEVDLYQFRSFLTRYYRETMLSFLEGGGITDESQLAKRHELAKDYILSCFRRNRKLGRNQERIRQEGLELLEELDQIFLLCNVFSFTTNAKLVNEVNGLKSKLQQQQAAKPAAAHTPAAEKKLALERVSPRRCFWQEDEYIYNDGTRCCRYGIWEDAKGKHYKEAWSDFTKMTFASLKAKLGNDQWFSLPLRIMKKDPQLPVCSSPSCRLLPADKVIM